MEISCSKVAIRIGIRSMLAKGFDLETSAKIVGVTLEEAKKVFEEWDNPEFSNNFDE